MYTQLLHYVCSWFNQNQIPYMVTGSVALNIYLLPRSTYDIDIVVEIPYRKVNEFLKLFETDFYIHHETVKTELSHRGIGMFNVIDHKSGYKIDFIVLQNKPYEIEKFNNRKTFNFEDIPISVCRPEDLVISKLQWIQELQSERQMNDIRNLLQYPNLDINYIEHWISELKLQTFDLFRTI